MKYCLVDIDKLRNLKYKKNNVVYFKDSTGNEYWHEFDDKERLTYYRNSNNFEIWKKYDDKNKLIYYRDSTGVNFSYPEKSKLFDK